MATQIAPADHRPRWQQLYVAAVSFFALFSIVGLALYGLPFFYDHMVTDFGWSRTQVTSGNAISKLIVGPLFGFAAGYLVDKLGPRRVMLTGILMAGTALIGLSYTSSIWMFYLFYLFNAFGYLFGGPLPNQVLISRWFDRARGKAMGFAYVGIGVGGTVVPLLAVALIEQFGWQGALRAIGIIIIALSFPLAFFVKDAPSDEASVKAARAAPSAPLSSVLRNKYFYLLAIGSMCSIGAVGGANQHLKLFFGLDLGIEEGRVATIVSLVLASSIAGRLFMGWLADRLPRKYVMLLIYSLVAGSIPLLFIARQPGMVYIFAVIFGVALGGDYMIIPLMAADLFGVRVLGRVMGIVLTADGVAEATIPMLVGYMRDTSGNYVSGFSTLIGLAAVGAVAVALLPRGPVADRREPVVAGAEAAASA
ncbi:MAG TPA: MFS transporter [Longimicrobiaceae bacterium]